MSYDNFQGFDFYVKLLYNTVYTHETYQGYSGI
jgi:hypothetical protein